MVRRGFSLAEVIVAITLLATATLALAAAGAAAQRALTVAELQERAVRSAAALLDSLSFSDVAGEDSTAAGAITLHWRAPAGGAVPIFVSARYRVADRLVTHGFVTRRVPRLPGRQP